MCMSRAVCCCCQACLAILFLKSFAVKLIESLIQNHVLARDHTSCLPRIIGLTNLIVKQLQGNVEIFTTYVYVCTCSVWIF